MKHHNRPGPGDPLPRTDAPHASIEVPNVLAPAPVKPAAVPVQPPGVIEQRMKPAEYARAAFRIIPAAGLSFEDVLAPSYWRHVAPKLTVGDLVEIYPEGGCYFAVVLVRDVSRAAAVVSPIGFTEFEAIEGSGSSEIDGLVISFIPSLGWSVTRKADKARLSEGHKTKADALAWTAENSRRV